MKCACVSGSVSTHVQEQRPSRQLGPAPQLRPGGTVPGLQRARQGPRRQGKRPQMAGGALRPGQIPTQRRAAQRRAAGRRQAGPKRRFRPNTAPPRETRPHHVPPVPALPPAACTGAFLDPWAPANPQMRHRAGTGPAAERMRTALNPRRTAAAWPQPARTSRRLRWVFRMPTCE